MESITMNKEFNNPFDTLEWVEISPKIKQGILYRDENSGTYVRVLKLAPGAVAGKDALCHEFDEVVFIVSGGLVNPRLNERYEAGNYAYFPMGVKHGPLEAPVGATVIECRHYLR